jgi:DNA-binding NarL/FixJ family response regulator
VESFLEFNEDQGQSIETMGEAGSFYLPISVNRIGQSSIESMYLRMHIIIADHHSKARKALVALLHERREMDVISEVTEPIRLLELAHQQPVDTILLDYGLPGVPLAGLIKQLHAIKQSPIVVVLGSNPEHARLALNIGADVFVSKGDPPEWLLAVLDRCERRPEDMNS